MIVIPTVPQWVGLRVSHNHHASDLLLQACQAAEQQATHRELGSGHHSGLA